MASNTHTVRFIKGPSRFMITDELVITFLSSASFIDKLNVPLADIDEVTVEVGEEEVNSQYNSFKLCRFSILFPLATKICTTFTSQPCVKSTTSFNSPEILVLLC